MYKLFIILIAFVFVSCGDITYFIIRHGEKDGTSMSQNPTLSEEGKKQAQDLMKYLEKEKIKHIYSTDFIRTLSTAEPTSQQFKIDIQKYDPRGHDALISKLKSINDGDVLVVGHSNTVDDLVNGLLGEKKLSDLPESEYAIVYKVTKKKDTYTLERVALPRVTSRTGQ